MRQGRFDEAAGVFREFVLQPGCTWMRQDLPTIYKTNFATSLLLCGYPSGCIEMLNGIKDETHSSVQRLRATIARWEAGLSFWQKLNWRFGKIDPANRPVTLDFPPGEFEEGTVSRDVPAPAPPAAPERPAA